MTPQVAAFSCSESDTAQVHKIGCDAVAKYAFELSNSCAPGATRLIPCIRSCRLLAASAEETKVSLCYETPLSRSLFPIAHVPRRRIARGTIDTLAVAGGSPTPLDAGSCAANETVVPIGVRDPPS